MRVQSTLIRYNNKLVFRIYSLGSRCACVVLTTDIRYAYDPVTIHGTHDIMLPKR